MFVSLSSFVGLTAALVGIYYVYLYEPDVPFSHTYNGDTLTFRRINGVTHWNGSKDDHFYFGQGCISGRDRLAQICLYRALAEGKVGETFLIDNRTIKLDMAMRAHDIYSLAKLLMKITEEQDPTVARRLYAFSEGVNQCSKAKPRPIEFVLANAYPRDWEPTDSMAVAIAFAYVGLVSIQGEVEKVVLQAIKDGAPLGSASDALRVMFPGQLDTLAQDAELLEIIRNKLNFHEEVPLDELPLAALRASNNWVLHGNLTASGKPLLASDPHVSLQLPALFIEFMYETADNYAFGIAMPGVPGMLMGRTRYVAFGFTYGMADQADYYVEEIRGGMVRRGDSFTEPVRMHKEYVKTGKNSSAALSIFYTSIGRVELGSNVPHDADQLPDGFYLALRWSWWDMDIVQIKAMGDYSLRFRTVDDLRKHHCHNCLSGNYVAADIDGNIAFFQSGILPHRSKDHLSSIVPLKGWLNATHWQDVRSCDATHSRVNPPAGFFATANDIHVQALDLPPFINLDQGAYRYDRATQLIHRGTADGRKMTIADMQAMQVDLYSLQAERFMAVLHDLIPPTTASGRDLLAWDYRQNKESRGAALFSQIYHRLANETLGKRIFGEQGWQYIISHGGSAIVVLPKFDQLLLGPNHAVALAQIGITNRTEFLRQIVNELLGPNSTDPVVLDTQANYGSLRPKRFNNIILDGIFPIFVGFDRGPFPQEGTQATLLQGVSSIRQGVLVHGGPAWRFVTDMAYSLSWISLPGGPSGNPFNPSYTSKLTDYMNYVYDCFPLPFY